MTDQKTLRDEFAMAALNGCLAGALACGRSFAPNEEAVFAVVAYTLADAMMAERAARAQGEK